MSLFRQLAISLDLRRTTHGAAGKIVYGPLFDIDPHALIGQPVKIYWDGESKYYSGVVSSFDPSTWKHKVGQVTHGAWRMALHGWES